jgi:hypothetical protein
MRREASPTTVSRSPIRWRPLLAVTALVVVVHGWMLQPPPGAFQPAAGARPRPLITRTVETPSPPVEMPVALPTPAPPKVAPPARPANPRPDFIAANVQSAPHPPATPKPSAARTSVFAIPGSMVLHYQVTAHTRGLVLNAQGQLHWHHDGNEYDARLELNGPLLPSRVQQSTGRITAEGLAPLRFSDKARSEEAAHFQREEGKVSFSSNRPDAPLTPGAQDRLSVVIQLGAMIAGKPENFAPGTAISIQTANTRDAEVWQFTVEGEETLRLPGGELSALKLVRNPRKEFDQKIELWLAPGMAYVPVRLRLTQPNGDWVDQQWSSTDKG